MNKNEVKRMRPLNVMINLKRLDLVGLFVLWFHIITLLK